MTDPALDRQIQVIERPDSALLTYYILTAVAVPPIFLFLGPFLYFRYHTMRYKFSEDGISMSWGILFRRQVIVNYARIQDIHLKSNVVERWLGLSRILVQTASGNSSAEMTIEGIKEFEPLRDFLYSRMRGVRDGHDHATTVSTPSPSVTTQPRDELAATLREATRELRAIREILGQRPHGRPEDSRDV